MRQRYGQGRNERQESTRSGRHDADDPCSVRATGHPPMARRKPLCKHNQSDCVRSLTTKFRAMPADDFRKVSRVVATVSGHTGRVACPTRESMVRPNRANEGVVRREMCLSVIRIDRDEFPSGGLPASYEAGDLKWRNRVPPRTELRIR